MINTFKGFNKDMTCCGKLYEEGKTYIENDANDYGMNACEYPLDCFNYYTPGHSVYHAVEQAGKLSHSDDDDTKVASTEMKIGARLDVRSLVKAAINFTKSRITMKYADAKFATAGYKEAAITGHDGTAAAGRYGVAIAKDYGAATAGCKGAAIAKDYGAATAGYKGAATVGDKGVAAAGHYGAAIARNYGVATVGNFGAVAVGLRGVATAGADGAAVAGNYGTATSRGSAYSGKKGLSVARGNNVRVKGDLGAILVIAEEDIDSYDITNWKAVVVDDVAIKANTWYTLNGDTLVECGSE